MTTKLVNTSFLTNDEACSALELCARWYADAPLLVKAVCSAGDLSNSDKLKVMALRCFRPFDSWRREIGTASQDLTESCSRDWVVVNTKLPEIAALLTRLVDKSVSEELRNT